MKKLEIPLSEHAYQEIDKTKPEKVLNFLIYFMGPVVLSIFGLLITGAFYERASMMPTFWFYIWGAIATVPYLSCLLNYSLRFYGDNRRKRAEIYEANKIDYERSHGLKAALESFKLLNPASPEDCPTVSDQEIPGKWKPVEVTRYVSQGIRQSLNSDFGYVVPQLLESSSVILCQNMDNKSETLEVLIPSHSVIKDQIIRTVQSAESHTTHCKEVLDEFSLNEDAFLNALSHPDQINYIKTTCSPSVPLEERPTLTIKSIGGKMLRPGVAIASSIALPGEEEVMFYPSGFCEQINRRLAPYTTQDFKMQPALASAGGNITPESKQLTAGSCNQTAFNDSQFHEKVLFAKAENRGT